MHKIRLIAVGKIKTSWIAEGCKVYEDRLRHHCAFEISTVEAGTPEREEEKLIKALAKEKGKIILLDEAGKEFDSRGFASLIQSDKNTGTPLVFVIGGAYGLGAQVRALASAKISLSKMTFPHELAQLFFLEQLFRAHSIMQGSGYHH